MSTRRRGESTIQDSPALAVGVSDIDSVIQKTVTVLRDEFNNAIIAATKALKDELTKLISVALSEIAERIDCLESRLVAVEAKQSTQTGSNSSDDMTSYGEAMKEIDCVKREARESLLVANDSEQYNRRNNIRIRGLSIKKEEDCRQAVADFLRTKLQIQDVHAEDLEAAHPLPARPRAVKYNYIVCRSAITENHTNGNCSFSSASSS